MQLPDITISRLENIDDTTLTDLCYAITVMRAEATEKEEQTTWEIVLAAVEVELWSRGYGPEQKQ